MERLTCYESILYQLLVFNYATKKSLLLLNFSKDAIYRAVERGLEERTISDGRMTYNIKGVSRKHQLTYLTITPIGIEYLKQKCSHKVQWLSNLSVEDSERVQIKGTQPFQRITRNGSFGQQYQCRWRWKLASAER